MTRRVQALLVLAGLSVVVALATALATAEVVARGKLVPSGGSGVRRVRVWDSVEFYISSETANPSLDVLTTIAFAMLSAAMGLAALMLAVSQVQLRLVAFFAIVACAAAYLAADELLAIHESIGHNLQFLRSLPGVERPDDLVLASYALAIGLYGWAFSDVLRSAGSSVWLLASALVVAGAASVSDFVGVGQWEERAELGAAVLATAGFVVLATRLVPEALLASEPQSDVAAR